MNLLHHSSTKSSRCTISARPRYPRIASISSVRRPTSALGVGGVEVGEVLGDGGAVGGADQDGVAALEAALDGDHTGEERTGAAL